MKQWKKHMNNVQKLTSFKDTLHLTHPVSSDEQDQEEFSLQASSQNVKKLILVNENQILMRQLRRRLEKFFISYNDQNELQQNPDGFVIP